MEHFPTKMEHLEMPNSSSRLYVSLLSTLVPNESIRLMGAERCRASLRIVLPVTCSLGPFACASNKNETIARLKRCSWVRQHAQ